MRGDGAESTRMNDAYCKCANLIKMELNFKMTVEKKLEMDIYQVFSNSFCGCWVASFARYWSREPSSSYVD